MIGTLTEDTMVDLLMRNGVDSSSAHTLAQACASSIDKGTVAGFGVGLGVGLATSNPGTLLLALLMGGAGAGLAAAGSPSCSEVREAAFRALAHLNSSPAASFDP
ncbi:MAG: hypothetical protein U0572_00125 [Phycisphaerales bacterium]